MPMPRALSDPPQGRRVLSVQSHVIFGYVGNKAATLPLQLHGLDVDPVNTVQFSNHTGYPACTGDRLDGDQLRQLVEGLDKNGLLECYSHLLTGYIGRVSFTLELAQHILLLRERAPRLFFLCDPVLGDHGKLYVPPELIPAYRDELCPLADLITPNAFEAELLTGLDCPVDAANAPLALERLHALGVPLVVITSAVVPENPSLLRLFGSCRVPNCAPRRFSITFPRFDGSYTGTGDLFAAVLLAKLSRLTSKQSAPLDWGLVLQRACERAIAVLQHILERAAGCAAPISGESDSSRAQRLELPIIGAADLFTADLPGPSADVF